MGQSVIYQQPFLRGFDMAIIPPDPWNRDLEKIVKEALKSVQFGTITLVVQDGRVIQVDKNEKIRVDRSGHIFGSGI
jgi:hypothetical protein